MAAAGTVAATGPSPRTPLQPLPPSRGGGRPRRGPRQGKDMRRCVVTRVLAPRSTLLRVTRVPTAIATAAAAAAATTAAAAATAAASTTAAAAPPSEAVAAAATEAAAAAEAVAAAAATASPYVVVVAGTPGSGTAQGRSAYLTAEPAVVATARRRRALDRAVRAPLTDAAWATLARLAAEAAAAAAEAAKAAMAEGEEVGKEEGEATGEGEAGRSTGGWGGGDGCRDKG